MPASAAPRASRRQRPSAASDADLLSIAGLFSRRAFRALAADRQEPVREVVRSLLSVFPQAGSMSLGEVFDEALRVMAKQYRNEYVFKNALVSRIVFGRHNTRTASALLELRAGPSIADVAIFNGTSTAYEIKTDLDSLTRLDAQIRDYSRHFARVHVVTTERMASRVAHAVPDHVGVLVLTGRGCLSEVRGATEDVDRLSTVALFGLLRRGEVLRILDRTRGYEIDVPPARLWHRTRELFEDLPVDLAHREMVDELRSRGMSGAATAAIAPRSLRALAYEVPLSGSATGRIHGRLSMPVGALTG